MENWSARVEWTTHEQPTDDQIEQLAVQLQEHAASIGIEPPGNPSAQMSIWAGTLRQAFTSALRAVESACAEVGMPCTVVGVDVCTWDEFTRRLDSPAIPPLVGYSEIAAELGVSRQRARELPATFPDQLAEVARTSNGPLFLRSQLQRFADTWERRRTGRPPKNAGDQAGTA